MDRLRLVSSNGIAADRVVVSGQGTGRPSFLSPRCPYPFTPKELKNGLVALWKFERNGLVVDPWANAALNAELVSGWPFVGNRPLSPVARLLALLPVANRAAWSCEVRFEVLGNTARPLPSWKAA